jgi:hypothetical protein
MDPKQTLSGIPVSDCGPIDGFTAALAIKHISDWNRNFDVIRSATKTPRHQD